LQNEYRLFLILLRCFALLASLGGCCLLLGSFFIVIPLDGSGVDELGAVLHHLLDQALLLELIQSFPGKRASDLEPFRDYCRCDQFVGRDFLELQIKIELNDSNCGIAQ